ncbi:hypothetical protein V5P93_006877 [Actinokineospora auranticolor]|nr:hypothetical protein [Actinokineospora auranticolor]
MSAFADALPRPEKPKTPEFRSTVSIESDEQKAFVPPQRVPGPVFSAAQG